MNASIPPPIQVLQEDNLIVTTTDLPDTDNLHYSYTIMFKNPNSSRVSLHAIKFQQGDPSVVGPNGVTNVILLQVLHHRFVNTNPDVALVLQTLIDTL